MTTTTTTTTPDYFGTSATYGDDDGASGDSSCDGHNSNPAWTTLALISVNLPVDPLGVKLKVTQRRDERLLDVEDVAAGHQTKLVWNDPSAWISLTNPSHEALVSPEDFAAVQAEVSAGGHRPVARKGHRTNRTYILSGLVHCKSHWRLEPW